MYTLRFSTRTSNTTLPCPRYSLQIPESGPVNYRYPGLVVQTLGEKGVRLLSDGKEMNRVSSRRTTPNTVVGAGDFVMAGFIDAIINGSSYTEALEWSQIVVAEAMKGPYTCKIEPGVFKMELVLWKQVRRCRSILRKVFVCEYCKEFTPSSGSLYHGTSIHTHNCIAEEYKDPITYYPAEN